MFMWHFASKEKGNKLTLYLRVEIDCRLLSLFGGVHNEFLGKIEAIITFSLDFTTYL